MSEKLFIAYMIGKIESLIDGATHDKSTDTAILKRVVCELMRLKIRAEQEIGFEPEIERDDD